MIRASSSRRDVGPGGGAFGAHQRFGERISPDAYWTRRSVRTRWRVWRFGAIERDALRPILEMQFADFSTVAFNQIVNQAATHFWRTNISCPITVRLPCGGTPGGRPFHSQTMEAIDLRALSGLVVLTPATVEDAYSMLLAAVAIDDPVIFCGTSFSITISRPIRLPTEALPVSKARIAREGRDLTLVTYSAMV